jgi:thioredoxin-related protein
MSKIVFLILISSFTLFAFEWKTYQSAQIEQQKTNKLIMIDVVRTGCHYCTDMEKDVFEDKEMAEWIENRFISVKMNLDDDELPLDLKVSITPTFFFIDKNEKVVKKVPGSWNIEDFKSLTEKLK